MREISEPKSDYFSNLFNQFDDEVFNMFPPHSEQNPIVITELFFANSRFTIKTEPTTETKGG